MFFIPTITCENILLELKTLVYNTTLYYIDS